MACIAPPVKPGDVVKLSPYVGVEYSPANDEGSAENPDSASQGDRDSKLDSTSSTRAGLTQQFEGVKTIDEEGSGSCESSMPDVGTLSNEEISHVLRALDATQVFVRLVFPLQYGSGLLRSTPVGLLGENSAPPRGFDGGRANPCRDVFEAPRRPKLSRAVDSAVPGSGPYEHFAAYMDETVQYSLAGFGQDLPSFGSVTYTVLREQRGQACNVEHRKLTSSYHKSSVNELHRIDRVHQLQHTHRFTRRHSNVEVWN